MTKTQKTTLIHAVEAIILASQKKSTPHKKFKSARTYSAAEFVAMFSSAYPSLATINPTHLGNPDLLTAKEYSTLAGTYGNVNKIIREKGMYMKSSNYCSSFHLLGKKDEYKTYQSGKVTRITAKTNAEAVTAKVDDYKRRAKQSYEAAMSLQSGIITNNCKFKVPLTSAEIERASAGLTLYPFVKSYGL